jgi:enoyl-CoA hydratase/carnithine racemase
MTSRSAPLAVDRPAEGVLRLRLDRPERRNAIDTELIEALHGELAEPGARAVVLGSTSSAFCSGADLSLDDAERAAVSDRLYALYERMLAVPAPIVAAVAGHAVGAGAQLLLAADLRVAGPRARIRFPGPGHGLALGGWGLPSLVGRGRALDLCLTMRPVEADEALEIGLVERLEEDPEAAAVELAAAFAQLHPEAVARVKRHVTLAAAHAAALAEEREGNRSAWTGSVEGLVRERDS